MNPISDYPEQSLSDWAGLVLRAHHQLNGSHLYIHNSSGRIYKLADDVIKKIEPNPLHMSPLLRRDNDEQWTLEYEYRLSGDELLEHFERYAKEATHCDERPLKAVQLLQQRFQARFYSGILGKIRFVLNRLFGWFEFSHTSTAKRLAKLSQIIQKLPKPPSPHIPLVTTHISGNRVFTDNLKDRNAHGCLGDYSSERYHIRWMKPRAYLDQVDRHFNCPANDQRIQNIFKGMEEIILDIKQQKFAPVMLNPHIRHKVIDDYFIYEHEGRHRALCAEWLGISEIPVATAS